jgi:metallo-beta-lactamase class B
MVKSAKARNPGFIADADMAVWPLSVKKVQQRYPQARIVVPGHGRWGGLELLSHTVKLCHQFNEKATTTTSP